MAKKFPVTAEELFEKLQFRLGDSGWVVLPQVRNGTGFYRGVRTADALAMSTWPSRGLELHGFEIKVARADWLSELKNPEKADAIAQFCDYWWIIGSKDIINVNEVPDNWGWYVPYGKTLKINKSAKKLKAEPVDRLFLASILRSASQVIIPTAKLDIEYDKGYAKGVEDEEDRHKYAKEDHNKLEKLVSEFEKVSGVKLNRWMYPTEGKRIGEAVKFVLANGHLATKNKLIDMKETAQRILEFIDKEIKKVD